MEAGSEEVQEVEGGDAMSFDIQKLMLLVSKWLKRPVEKVIGFDYDEEADVLAIHIKDGFLVDMEPLDEWGDVMAHLNERGEIIGLTFMNASKYLAEIRLPQLPHRA